MGIKYDSSKWLQSIVLCFFVSLVLASAGCGGNSSSTTKTIRSIAVTPSPATIAAAATQQFAATATYSDGTTANVTTTATWTSATTTVATISASGLATAVASGSSAITASLSGVSGTAMLTVSASTATLTSIAVTPNPASITVGATQQFTATGTYSDGSTKNLSSTATWTSGTATVATISASGLATAVASGSTTITASLSGVSGKATLTVSAASQSVTSIAVTPNPGSIVVGATQQFTATATYSNGSTSNVSSTATWTVANTAVGTVTTSGLATAVAAGSTTVTASVNGISGNDAFNVTVAPGNAVSVTTWHFDNNRSGLNAREQSLTPVNVTPQTFGKLFSYLVDGYAYAEPLLVSNVTIGGKVHNVLYVATEHDSVYAFDADSYGTGAPLWQVSLLQTGETPVVNPGDDLQPYDGITSTPVIDPTTNTMYVVSKQTKAHVSSFRLSALDITTGAQKFGGPVTVTASVPGTNSQAGNGTTVSLTTECIQRSALLLANGNVYFGFGNCPTGWLLAYNKQTLAQVGEFDASPNIADASDIEYGSAGGIWMGSGGPAADSAGNVYVATGNGPWDGMTAWGDSVLKFPPTPTAGPNGSMQPSDYFTPDNYQYMDCNDADLDSGGVMLIPGTAPTQLLVGGKTGKLYLLNTTNLGKEQANDAGATQSFYFEPDVDSAYPRSCTDSAGTYTTDVNSYEEWGIAAYFNGALYLGVSPTSLVAQVQPGTREFTISGNTLTLGTLATPNIQQYAPGTTPFVSANGTTNGIMWMIDEGVPIQSQAPGAGAATNATLRAYNANNLTNELYNSSVNSGDVPGLGIKFSSPIVANGKVYISTGHDPVTATNPQGEIDVYGLN